MLLRASLPNGNQWIKRLVLTVLAVQATSSWAADWWRITTVDSNGDVGRWTSLAVLPSGKTAISYYDVANGDLKFAQLQDSGWQTTTVDSLNDAGISSSLLILPSGQPAISYAGYGDLKYASFDGTAWQLADIHDPAGSVLYTSLAILPNGQPAISYFVSAPENGLYYAWFDNGWHWTPVDGNGAGEWCSLAILPNGAPAISYYDAANGDLKYAVFEQFVGWQIQTVESNQDIGWYSSLAILPNGQPAIGYFQHGAANQDYPKYAYFDNGNWHISYVEQAGVKGGFWFSLRILPTGYPAMSYQLRLPSNLLRYAWFDGTTWHPSTVDAAGSVGEYTSLAILPSGQPAISYYDSLNGDLKYATRFQIGDMNCDGVLDYFDIDPFVVALLIPSQYAPQYPNCNLQLADINGDGFIDNFDIDPFIDLLIGG